ncbi:hypothetical protein GCM10023353_00190 [Tomitella cavernea]|uniref:Penicillin-binding protein transpeptidase domain-containing protein n=1 Tax=Tomitella cavernea TaxID=1387982 RepID=A0ABP9BZG8_9ACTN
MIGFTPSLSTAVWVGDITSGKPLTNYAGNTIYGSGLPSDIWKSAMDGALKGTDFETFPTPKSIGGVAGVPQWTRESPTTTTGPAPTTTGRRRRRRPAMTGSRTSSCRRSRRRRSWACRCR